MNKNYDLIIIGSGAAGFAAAIKAKELKIKAAMINSGLPLGGTCVNVGCIPSKALIHYGEIIHNIKNNFSEAIEIEIKKINFEKIIEEELMLVEMLREKKYKKVLQDMNNVDFYEGYAEFTSPQEIIVNSKKLYAEKYIIATGSRTAIPPISGINETGYITHIEALRLKKQPKELAIIGAGPLGLEFGQIFNRLGSKVTIIEMLSTIYQSGEKQLVERLQKILEKEGIQIETSARVKSAKKIKDKKIIIYEIQGKEKEIVVDEIMLATGRKANTEKLHPERAQVEVDKRGAIIVNSFLQTTNRNIFAAGDVINLPMRLETTAGYEGTLAVENAFENQKKEIDYLSVPYAIFTDPQLAGVGYTAEEFIKKFQICSCREINFTELAKATIIKRTEGMIKILVDPKTTEIVGVHILSANASDLIAQGMIMVKKKMTIDEIITTLPVFPTLSEAIKLAALSFKKDITKLSCCI